MRPKLLLLLFLLSVGLLFTRCSQNNAGEDLIGKWEANWKTSKNAFPNVKNNVSFTMNGLMEFEPNDQSVTITAYGYPGCIFSSDTLRHSQKWKVKSDTLELLNDGDIHGITYLIKKKSQDKIELVLMGDIMIELSRL